MPWAILTSKWTWYTIGAVVIGLYGWHLYADYENMKTQAAKVPGLEAKVSSYSAQAKANEGRASQISAELTKAEIQRDQAEADLHSWNDMKADLSKSLTEATKHASATVNPICLPSDAERQLWNTTLVALTAANASTGQTRTGSPVPVSSPGTH